MSIICTREIYLQLQQQNMGFRGVAFQLMLAEMLLTATLVISLLSKPRCDDALCGDVKISYPFGTSLDCSLNKYFLIVCDLSSTPPKALYRNASAIHVTNITNSQLHVISFISRRCHPSKRANSPWYNWSDVMTISNTENKFTVIGCNSYAYIRGQIDNRKYETGCISLCENISYVDEGSCTGTGCCQIDIPKGLKKINYTAYSFNNGSQTNISDLDRCTYAFVAEQSKFKFKPSYIFDNLTENFPMVLDWAITGNAEREECKENAVRINTTEDGSAYRCKCETGYEGNPYLSNSCQGVGIFFVVLLVSSTWLYLVLRNRKLIKLKEKFFRQNGGFLLQQQLSKRSGSSETAKIFTAEELKKATNNYDESRIIGRGEGCLFEILENYIVYDGNEEQLKEVAELAKICLKVKGEERPTMREVAMELDGLRMMHKHSWVNAESNPEETEHLLRDTSDVYKCADGSSTSARYDSIKDHVLVVFDDGR
ncbi:hypothetical protein Pint_23924 [Pistacia integerrima]|uniref:Uncharacterized protein n=1 Tax=Pistacia integerrima TaxID=434235 RepID=A0ACC0YLR9_9ROSI|nr:hypothetical protein Pint_23924 [Pistacia integerrima]